MKTNYSESDFDANDNHPLSNMGKFVIKSISIFENKSKIEGFIHLHGALEAQLFAIWELYLVFTAEEKFTPLKRFLDFKDSIELLKQVSIINQTLESKLLAFKAGRDNVAHLMSNKFMKKNIRDKTLNDQFKKGVSAFKELIRARKELVKEMESRAKYDEAVYIEIDPTPKGSTIIKVIKEHEVIQPITLSAKTMMRATGLAIKEERNYKNIFSNADPTEFEKIDDAKG